MGTDALDLIFRCEQEFGVRLDRAAFLDLLRQGNTGDPPQGRWTDVRAADFAGWIQDSLEKQGVGCDRDVFAVVRKVIAECLLVPEQEVTPDAWLCRDLGAE